MLGQQAEAGEDELAMEYPVHLLTVKDRFQVAGRDLILIPSLDYPEGFSSLRTTVTVRVPSGQERLEPVLFSASHFIFVGGDRKWVIEVILQDAMKDSVPVGSKLFVTVEDAKKLGTLQR